MSEVPKEILEEFDSLRMVAREAVTQSLLEIEYAKPWEKGGLGPYKWQVDFHNAGRKHRERALISGNRTGKSRSCAAEVAIHCTGKYPSWWEGHQFTVPIECWVCGTTNEDVRNIQQAALLGTITEDRSASGTGWIPKDDIKDISFRQGTGVANIAETIKVNHISGGVSIINLKSYEQGAVKFQGVAKHLVWMDEEPEKAGEDIFSEIQMRLVDHRGLMIFSRTPLFGLTKIVRYFIEGTGNSYKTMVGWKDCPHWTDEMIKEESEKMPRHELQARMNGIPKLGSGGIYEIDDSLITCDPFEIPSHFRRIAGIDLGIDHPTAVVWLALDPDNDILYLYDSYKKSNETPIYHGSMIKTRGQGIPLAMPHDSLVREKGTGTQMMQHYKDQGCNVIELTARYDDAKGGGQSPEPAIVDMQTRMRTGRFKVFSNQVEWMAEKNQYHRDNGKIVRIDDDMISATHYALIMLRYAATQSDYDLRHSGRGRPRFQDQTEYDPYTILQ